MKKIRYSPSELMYVGQVSVDSGQVVIVDPCYVAEKGLDYDEVCATTSPCGSWMRGHAVASRSGYGDGGYPVYAEISDTGDGWGTRVRRIVIDFDLEDEDG